MSVVSVIEISSGRGGHDQQDKLVREYNRVFKVQVSSLNDGVSQVLAAIPVRLFDPYLTSTEYDMAATCIRRNVSNTEPYFFEIDCEYTSDKDEQKNEQQEREENETEPTERPLEISIDFTPTQIPVSTDINGAFIGSPVNPVEPPDPLPIKDQMRCTIRLQKNFSSFDPHTAGEYADAINSDTYLGFGRKELKIMGMSAKKKTEKGQVFWEVNCEIQVAPKIVIEEKDAGGSTVVNNYYDWDLHLLSQGFWEMSGGNKILATDTIDGKKVPVTSPVLLKGDGTRLTASDPPHYTHYQIYHEMAFSSLGFF